jgi:hypothetical protein
MMPVCDLCGADGVVEVNGVWFCNDHYENALLNVASMLSHIRGWDVEETISQLREWLES